MQSHKYVLKPSKIYWIMVLAIWLVSLIAINQLPFSNLLKILDVIVVTCYCLYIAKQPVRTLTLTEKGEWVIDDAKGQKRGALDGSSTVTSLACVLRFRDLDRSSMMDCVVFCDAMPRNEYKQLILATTINKT